MEQEKIALTLNYSRSDVRIVQTVFGVELTLEDGVISSNPGEPGFPIHNVEVAIPKGIEVSRVTSRVIQTTPLTSSPTYVIPVCEELLPYRQLDEPIGSESHWVEPDKSSYEDAVKNMRRRNAWLIGSRVEGPIYVAAIAIRPIRYDEFACLELITELELKISLKPMKTKPLRILRAEESLDMTAERLNLLEKRVLNPNLVRKMHSRIEKRMQLKRSLLKDHLPVPGFIDVDGPDFITMTGRVDYLIITDSHTWDAKTISPLEYVGDLPGAFKPLARLRARHGLSTHIARIRDIVGGCYGNFRDNARDLQEVIRNFLKYFVKTYHTEYLLIGGTVSIVPTRLACAFIGPDSISPEGAFLGKVEWKGTYGAMYLGLNEHGRPYFGYIGETLTTERNGKIIPYNESGSNDHPGPCWYHTTDDSFSTFSETNTKYIRINAPESVVRGKFIWYGKENLIPTDLYYASLFNENFYDLPGKHDWDYLGNGLYGQWTDSKNLDRVDYLPDLCYGRVPVKTVSEVKTFIRKIKAYEQSNDRPDEAERFNKVLLVADRFEHNTKIYREKGNPELPGKNMYLHLAKEGLTLIHLKEKPGRPFSLFSYRNDSGYQQVPDNQWYFAKWPYYLVPSTATLEFNWPLSARTIRVPTKLIVVTSANHQNLQPDHYLIDSIGLDSAIEAQENIRETIRKNRPSIQNIHRLYDYEKELWQKSFPAGTTLQLLTEKNLSEELSPKQHSGLSPHIVSMSGHGYPGGSCFYDKSVLAGLNNQDQTFIILSDGCSTSKYDNAYDDFISRRSIIDENGGAIAYLGFSAMSFCGYGAWFTKRFFELFTANLRRSYLGQLFSTSNVLLPKHYENKENGVCGWADCAFRWMALAYNLIGDPVLPVFLDKNDMESMYVANKKTKELHKRNCSWVKEMAD